jgi:NTP pyrophosphatase (non-canonical NTP hydrolase)
MKYHQQAMQFKKATRNDLLHGVLGLCSESGEVLDLYKKSMYKQTNLDREKFIEELGDVCWYIELLCDVLNITREQIEQINIKKLEQRYNL